MRTLETNKKVSSYLVVTVALLCGGQLCSQNFYTVDQEFSTDMRFRDCKPVTYFHEREDGVFVVAGLFEVSSHSWNPSQAKRWALMNPDGSENPGWTGSTFLHPTPYLMQEYDEDNLLVCNGGAAVLLNKYTGERTSPFYPYTMSSAAPEQPFPWRFNRDAYIFDDMSVICAGAMITDSTDHTRWRHLFRFHSDGMVDAEFPPIEAEPNNHPHTGGTRIRRLSDGSWILNGRFSGVNGHHSPHFVKLTSEFLVDTTFVSPFGFTQSPAYPILGLIDSESKLWITGVSIRYPDGELDPHNLYKLNSDGTFVEEFTPGILGGPDYIQGEFHAYSNSWYINAIHELETEEDRFILAGKFGIYNDTTSLTIAVVDGKGHHQQDYFNGGGTTHAYCSYNQNSPPFQAGVRTVKELGDGGLLLGGVFSDFMGSTAYNIVKLNKGTVSVQNIVQSKELKIYPNPARDHLHVDCECDWHVAEILSIDGRQVHSINQADSGESTFTIDLNRVPEGIYILRIFNQYQHSTSAKFVVLR